MPAFCGNVIFKMGNFTMSCITFIIPQSIYKEAESTMLITKLPNTIDFNVVLVGSIDPIRASVASTVKSLTSILYSLCPSAEVSSRLSLGLAESLAVSMPTE